jgi:outer membrane lipoprotein-sorting protein
MNNLKIQNRTSLVRLIALLVAAISPFIGNSQSLPSGMEIAKKTHDRNDGANVSRKLTMELIDTRGKSRIRETKTFRKYFGTERRTAIFYETPSNVKGTAFLVYDYPDAKVDDDQWLYLPALRKTRRISASNRGDYFLGTDFTYEDIKLESKLSVEDYNYKTIGKEEIDGHEVYVVEATPIDSETAKELGYSKMKAWVDAKNWMIRKGEFWDVAGNHLKTTYIKDIRLIQNIWTGHTVEIENHKTGHKTKFTFSEVDYTTVIDDDFFTQQTLVRGL